jgi:hypothetical protein
MVLNFSKRYEPSVDPFEDLEVIDQRGPRTLQTFVALMTGLGFALDAQWLVALAGLQLIIGLVFGRKFCLPCVFYFKVLQPRFGEGRVEDSRPPRFANLVGAIFLTTATLAFVVGLTTVGWVLSLIVTTLATFAAVSGICVGCEMYAAFARVRGIQLATR